MKLFNFIKNKESENKVENKIISKNEEVVKQKNLPKEKH